MFQETCATQARPLGCELPCLMNSVSFGLRSVSGDAQRQMPNGTAKIPSGGYLRGKNCRLFPI
jgi:hypothetical protein